jgi:hypothetical protein
MGPKKMRPLRKPPRCFFVESLSFKTPILHHSNTPVLKIDLLSRVKL